MSAKIPSKQLSFGLMAGDASTDLVITNFNIPLANTEYAHSLQAGLKQLTISNRTKGHLKVALIPGDSGTIYKTIWWGSCWTLDGLNFTGQTLYIQSTAPTIVEIVEYF